MNKFKYFFISVISLLLLSSCKQFFADLAEDLSYWSSTAFIKGELFPSRIYKDNEGYSCISSFSSALAQPDGSVSITLKLSNPKSYMFKMPGGAGVPDDIIVFEKNVKGTAGNAPSVNADYTMSQTDSTTIVLTLKNNFLQKSEWGSQNLSPTITLYNKDGRIFPQKYTFKLRANTPPPDLEYMATGKTKTAENGKHYYVLCFKVKNKDDMSKTVIGGELLHKDIAAISITPQGGAAQSIPLTLNASNTDFNINNSGGLLLPAGNVIKLSSADVDTGTTPDDLPSGNWVLFYKTGVEVKAAAAKTQYKIALEDEKGVRSAILTAEVKAPKPAPGPTLGGLTVEHNGSTLPFRDSQDSTGTSFNAGTFEYYAFVPDITAPYVTINATPSPGALIRSITAVKSDGTALTVSGNSVPLPSAGDISKVTVTVSKDRAETPYTIHIKRKSYLFTVEASPEGAGTVHITEEKGISVVSGNGSGNCKVKAEVGALVEMTARGKNTYVFKKWKKKTVAMVQLSTDSSYIYTVDIHDNDIIAEYAAGTVIDSTIPAAERWKKLKEAVQNAQDGDTITIVGEIKATSDSGNSGEIIIDKDLTIQGKTGAASDILDANKSAFTDKKDKHRIFHVKDGKKLTLKKLTLKNGAVGNKAAAGGYGTRGGGILLKSGTVSLSDVTLSGCKAITDSGEGGLHGNGAGIYVVSGDIIMENTTLSENNADAYGGAVYLKGGTLAMKGSTVVTPSTISNANKTGKNDVYLKNGAKIIVDDALTGTAPVARIRVAYNEYLPTRQVLDGTAVASHNTKFIVTDQDLGTDNGGVHVRKWKIKSNGYLQSEEVTLDGSKTRAWQALKDAVRTASDGDVIFIDGTIQATHLGYGKYVDNGEIVIDKNITIKAKSGTATLDANKDAGGKPKHRIFKVEAGKKLTLENLTLKNGYAKTAGDTLGGGILVTNGGKLTLKNTTISTCIADYGGAVYNEGGSVEISGGEVKGNTAQNGGGIYVKGTGTTLTMSGGKISANKAVADGNGGAGGGIFIDTGAKLTISGGTVGGSSDAEGNSAAVGGGIYMMDNGAKAEMTGGSITYNKADVSGGGVYISDTASPPHSLFTLKDGTISYNTAKSGGGIRAFGDFNMDGGTIEENTAIGDPDASLNLGTGGGINLVAATMNMTGGEIKNNHAKRSGGGVSLGLSGARDAVLNMSGGTISGNTITDPAGGDGAGVEFFTGSTTHGSTTYYTRMKMSGSAKVDTNNDVYVNNSRMITVDGALTGTAPVARLTPKNYSAGRQVLDGSAVGTEYAKFTVTPKDGKNWRVGSDGKLKPETVSISSSATDKWKLLKDAVRDIADGGTIVIEGLVQSTSAPGNNGEIIIDKDLTIQGKTGAASDILDANKGAFTDKKDKHRIFHVKDGKKLTLKKLTLKNGAVGNKAAAGGYGTMGGGILLESGTVSLSDVTLSGCRAITDSGVGGLHGMGGGIYVESGNIIMENTTLSANKADAYGGAVYLKGGTLAMKGSTVITESSNGDASKRNINDVRLAEGAKIILDGALTGSVPVARITVWFNEYLPTRQVLDGTAVGSNNTKFTVTDQNLGTDNNYSHVRKWKIASNGYLQSEGVTLDGSKTRAWQALKDAVRTASDGDVIAINGTIQATNAGSGEYVDNGEIAIDKNLTIKKADGASSAVIDANKDAGGKPKHRIFKVEAGKKLTLEKLKLTGGNATGTTNEENSGGAIYASGATVNITGCTIAGNEAKSGGAIYAVKKDSTSARVTVTGGTIGGTTAADANKATGSDGQGGAIYVGTGCALTLKDGAKVIGNTARLGGGVYTRGVFEMTGGEIKSNTAKYGGGIYVKDAGATLTMSGGTISENKAEKYSTDSGIGGDGGGVYIDDATFTLKAGTTISNNTAARDAGGVRLFGGTFTMEGGVIEGNTVTGTSTASGTGRAGGVEIVAATMNMKGGEIKNNTAKNGGGGVLLALSGAHNSVLNMSGGTISGNTLTNPAGTGKGVEFFTGSTTHGSTTYYTIMKMSGSAKVDVNNDVYVNDSRMITVDGALTGTAPVARITPKNYSAGLQVVEAENGVSIGDVTNKFNVTPQTAPSKNWIIDKGGCLRDFDGIGKDVIAAFDGDMSNKTIKKYNEMIGHFIFYKTNKGNYGVMTITETPLNGGANVYNMKFSYKTYTANGSVLKEGEETVTGTHYFDLDTGTMSTSSNQLESTRDFFLYNSINIVPQNNARFFTQNPPQ